MAFQTIKASLASATVIAFPDMNHTFELQTDASSVGAGETLLQPVGDETRIIAFASHWFSRTDSRRSPTERECMAVLWGVQHFRPYVAGRRFTLVTDCSALTWLFRSRDLRPKLHRWALRLMEYDMDLKWREGTKHVLPDAMSRLPHQEEPGADIDDAFPDDFSLSPPSEGGQPRGPRLDGQWLSELTRLECSHEELEPHPSHIECSPALPFAEPTSMPDAVESDSREVEEKGTHAPNEGLVDSGEASAGSEPRTDVVSAINGDAASSQPLRRSLRNRRPSVRLQFPGTARVVSVPTDTCMHLQPPAGLIQIEAPARDPTPVVPAPVSERAEVEEVLTAGGDKLGLEDSEETLVDTSAVERAMQVLTNIPNLMRHQKEDSFLAQIRSGLGGNEVDDADQAEARKVLRETDAEADAGSKVSDDEVREADSGGTAEPKANEGDDSAVRNGSEGLSSTESGEDNGDSNGIASKCTVSKEVLQKYRLDEKGVIWFSPKEEKPLLAIPAAMVPDVLALVHTLHGHVGVGATLALVRDRFHWPSVVKDTRQYVLSCSCRRRKRANSRKLAMTPVRAVDPWEELEIDLLTIDTTSRSNNKHILLVVDRASKFPFGFPLPTKEADGVARILAELCLTFGVPRKIRSDRGKEFRAQVVTHLCKWLKADIAFGPADHPRGQGAVERLGGWLLDILSELCKPWPHRWDEYISPALWVKRTLPT